MKAFQDVRQASDTISAAVPKMVKLTRATIDAAESIPDTDYLIKLILAGKLKKIGDMLESLKITKELPKLAVDLQEATYTIVEFVTKYSSRGQETVKVLEEVLSTAWEGYPLEFTTDSSGNVRAGLVEMQSIIRQEVQAPFRNVTDAIKALTKTLDSFPIKDGKFSFKAGVASYRRWSTVSMDLPCTRRATKKYEIAGVKGSFDYPEFYSCPYGPKTIPWPNHHIPYIKFRVG
jgi:hypothetical protein